MSRFQKCALGVVFLSLGCNEPQSINPPPAARICTLIRESRYREAIQLCDTLIVSEPQSVFLLLKRGEALRQLGNTAASRQTFEQVLKIEPLNRDAKFYLANASGELSQPAIAHKRDVESSSSITTPISSSNIQQRQQVDSVSRSKPEPTPSAAYQQFKRSLQQARRQQREAQIQANINRQLGSRVGWDQVPNEESTPRQIIRADLGLGLRFDTRSLVPIVTTGGSVVGAFDDDNEPTRRLGLVGQAMSGQRAEASQCFSMAVGPIGPFQDRLIPPYRAQCEDGIDNDGNLLADRFDPACWQDPADSRSYLPYLDEGIGVAFQGGQIPAQVPVPASPVSATPASAQ